MHTGSSTKTATAVDGLSKLVLNMIDLDIAASTYVLIARDKYGDWFIAEVLDAQDCSSGTGTGS